MPTDIPGLLWWLLTGTIAGGFAILGFFLSGWVKRIEGALREICQEIKTSRIAEGALAVEVSMIKARCEERHSGVGRRATDKE